MIPFAAPEIDPRSRVLNHTALALLTHMLWVGGRGE